jgi:hypothetical protein
MTFVGDNGTSYALDLDQSVLVAQGGVYRLTEGQLKTLMVDFARLASNDELNLALVEASGGPGNQTMRGDTTSSRGKSRAELRREIRELRRRIRLSKMQVEIGRTNALQFDGPSTMHFGQSGANCNDIANAIFDLQETHRATRRLYETSLRSLLLGASPTGTNTWGLPTFDLPETWEDWTNRFDPADALFVQSVGNIVLHQHIRLKYLSAVYSASGCHQNQWLDSNPSGVGGLPVGGLAGGRRIQITCQAKLVSILLPSGWIDVVADVCDAEFVDMN